MASRQGALAKDRALVVTVYSRVSALKTKPELIPEIDINLTLQSSALPFLLLLCALNCVAQEHFEVTRFIGYTRRSVFEQASVDDLVRGFPRAEFEVTRDLPATWISAKIRVVVDGRITKKKDTYPVQHINESTFPILDANTRSFTTPLPES
ncbi:MAG: hypothetical protein JWO48_2694, partial [Bryobacterales bacterium]|nr:hypothetical protein [Bryobacterales bacterium]